MIDRPVTLAFVGDIMLARKLTALLPTRPVQHYWTDLLPIFHATDGVVGNLECPITTHDTEWRRPWKAFRFRAHPSAIGLLTAAKVRLVNLANNHILDYEEEGLLDTLKHLSAASIGHAGAGENAYEAARTAVVKIGGIKVGFIGITDQMPEFSARHDCPGTNYVRIRTDNATLNFIRLLVDSSRQAGADLVILSCHWGPNLRPWPPRRYRDFARCAIEIGVDVFHGHSAHLVQGVELYRDGLILYDTGDILDDYWIFPGVRTDRSFVFIAEFGRHGLARLRMRPVTIERDFVRLAHGAEFDAICRQMRRRCAPFGTRLADTPDGLEALGPAAALPCEPATSPHRIGAHRDAAGSGFERRRESSVDAPPSRSAVGGGSRSRDTGDTP